MATSGDGFQLPDGFDVHAYHGVNQLMAVIANPNEQASPITKDAWAVYAGAHNGVAIRLRSANEYSDDFVQLMEHGPSNFETVYQEEKALNGCASSALSAVECTFMMSYAVGAVLASAHFPLTLAGHLQKHPPAIAEAFRSWVPSDAFTATLISVAGSPELIALTHLRNVLSHRGKLPRKHRLSTTDAPQPSSLPSNPRALAQDFLYNLDIAPALTRQHATWTTQACSSIVSELYVFLRRQRPDLA